MGAFKEENPITYRLEQMQKMWSREVKSDTQLVRWLVDREELRMVQAFILTEASEHGRVPELFYSFNIPFSGMEDYGKDLTNHWVETWNNEEFRKEVEHANVLPDWNDREFHDVESDGSRFTFLNCMSSFTNEVGEDEVMVLDIMPRGYNGNKEFAEWVKKCLKTIPSNLKMVVADLKERPLFKDIPQYIKSVTLEPTLNMNQAMKEIVSSGDTNNPSVGVNLCLLNMAEETKKKNEKQIDHWGKEGVRLAGETGFKSVESTVMLAWGSSYYQLKKFDKALKHYQKSITASKEGLDKEGATASATLLQSYVMLAATYFYQRKYGKAKENYLEAAKEADSQNNTLMLIEAYRQAAESAERAYNRDEADDYLLTAYQKGKEMDEQMQKFSSMLLISNMLHKSAIENGNQDFADEIADYAQNLWGPHWKDINQEEVYEQILTN